MMGQDDGHARCNYKLCVHVHIQYMHLGSLLSVLLKVQFSYVAVRALSPLCVHTRTHG